MFKLQDNWNSGIVQHNLSTVNDNRILITLSALKLYNMKYFLFSILLLSISCTDNNLQEKLTTVQKELATAQEKINQLQSQIEPEGELVHLVFFKVKPDADQVALVAEVKKLENIKEVLDLEIGPFKDVGDSRSLSEYTMLMQMSFANKKDYDTYQTHPVHLTLKENLGQFTVGPPSTYDFIKK